MSLCAYKQVLRVHPPFHKKSFKGLKLLLGICLIASCKPKDSIDPPKNLTIPSSDVLFPGAVPQFQNPEANQFVKDYEAFLGEFKEAYFALKQGDTKRYPALLSRGDQLELQGLKLQEKLSDQECLILNDYIQHRSQQIEKLILNKR